MKQKILFFISLIIVLFSCKKDSNNNNQTPISAIIEKSDYQSYEIVTLTSNNSSLSATSYSATIDGTVSVSMERTDSFLVFIMPQLNVASHSLTFDLGDGEQTISFNIIQGNVITDPDQYFANYLTTYDNRMLYNFSVADTLLSATDRSNFIADQQTIQNSMNTAVQNFNNLSIAEKNQIVQFLDANKVWMDELQTSIDDLNLVVGQLRINGVDDYDLRVAEAMINFQNIKREVVAKIPKIGSYVSFSCLFLSPAGCAIAVGVGIGYFLSEIQEMNLAIDKLFDVIYFPFLNLIGQRPSSITFNNGVARDVVVTMDYRTIYNGDGNSSVPLVQKIVGALLVIKQQWNVLLSKLPFGLSFGPTELSSISNYATANKRIHERYLTISNLSTNILTYQINRTDGFFELIFRGNNVTNPLNFNFNVNYNNSNFGSFSYPISGVFNNPCSGLSVTETLTNISGNICELSLQPSGGTAPYTFSWNSGETTSVITFTCGGSPSCTVTDANGCTVVW